MRLAMLWFAVINMACGIGPAILYVFSTQLPAINWYNVMLAYSIVTFVDAWYIIHRMFRDIESGNL